MNKHTKYTLNHAASLLVLAYKKAIAQYQAIRPLNPGVALEAPSCYDDLKSQAQAGKLLVSPEFCDKAIYGRDGNITFRIFHDYGHLLYDRQFTTADEVALAYRQWDDIAGHIDGKWREICFTVYIGDSVMQSLYEQENGKFPDDQRQFVGNHLEAYLNNRFKP